MQTVLLINKAIGGSHRIYPVCGASHKLYGNAAFDGPRGCPVFRMSVQEYDKAKFDLIGQTTAGQQWIPEFAMSPIGDIEAANKKLAAALDEIERLRAQIPPPPDPLLSEPIKALYRRAKNAGVNSFGKSRQTLVAAIRAAEKENQS